MRQPLANTLAHKGLTVWRIHGLIQMSVFLILLIGVSTLTYFLRGPAWLYFVYMALLVLIGLFCIYLFPKLRWHYWRYEVRETEIEIQHGMIIRTRTTIPMARVQHVDTVQGPILRNYQLAEIIISTAATIHKIPTLAIEEADALRQQISVLARVAEDDV